VLYPSARSGLVHKLSRSCPPSFFELSAPCASVLEYSLSLSAGSLIPDMSRNVSTGAMKPRPSAVQTAKSFTRFEPSKTSPGLGRNRASTIQTGVSPSRTELIISSPISPNRPSNGRPEDIFEKPHTDEDGALSPVLDPSLPRSQSLPERFDELPIELISLTDRQVR
jgi:hypothetical protein